MFLIEVYASKSAVFDFNIYQQHLDIANPSAFVKPKDSEEFIVGFDLKNSLLFLAYENNIIDVGLLNIISLNNYQLFPTTGIPFNIQL